MKIGKNGQMMLISVLIMVVLVISIALIVYMNQVNSRFGLLNRNAQQANASNEAGLDYAIHVLAASTTTWYNALNGQYPAEFYDTNSPVGNGLHLYNPALSKTAYTIRCSSSDLNTFSVYQLNVIVKSYTSQANGWVASKALSALVSQKSLAITLNDSTNASLAMQFGQVTDANFAVHWGPIAAFDASSTGNPWVVWGEIDTWRSPRKYALQGITGHGGSGSFPRSEPPSSRPTSDGLEYWAYTSMGNVPDIDLDSYALAAQNTSFDPAFAPVSYLAIQSTPSVRTPLLPTNCNAAVPNCAYFDVGNDTAVFSGATGSTHYNYTGPGTIIYIHGDAQLQDIAIDLKGDAWPAVFPSSGALIVDGDLNMRAAKASGLILTHMRVPLTAPLEYPLYGGTLIPCCPGGSANCPKLPNAYCTTSGNFNTNRCNFRGFLYVRGDLNYATTAAETFYENIDGVVRVDGFYSTHILSNGGQFGQQVFYYDDEINHGILTKYLQLQIDSNKAISASLD